MAEKPVLYLDVDGVLWDVDETGYHGAPGVAEFMDFALEHYEVRWCTSWGTSGRLRPASLELLAEWTGVAVSIWTQVRPSRGWRDLKTETVDWDEVDRGRTFIWIEDELLPEERAVLVGRGIEDWYIHADVLKDPNALLNALAELRKRQVTPTA